MTISALSRLSTKLLCHLRRELVAATPEERVRQGLLAQMVESLGYPLAQIAIEQELRGLPHLLGQRVPPRRADLIVFGSGVHPEHALFPLLLIECKAVPLTAQVKRQVLGYNRFVRAPYVALVNGEEILTGSYDAAAGEYRFVSGLPPFRVLSP